MVKNARLRGLSYNECPYNARFHWINDLSKVLHWMIDFRRFKFFCFIVLLLNVQEHVYSNGYGTGDHLVLSLLKIVTDSPSGPIDNDGTQYNIETYGRSYHFAFKQEAKCLELRYGNDLIWEHQFGGYPRALCVHLDLNQVFLHCGNMVSVYEYDSGRWNFRLSQTLNEFSEDGIVLVTKNSRGYKHHRRGISVYFELERGSECTEVRYRGQTLWQYGEETDNKYPKRVYFNLFKKIIVVDFRSSYVILSYRSAGAELVRKTEIDKVNSSMVTLVTEDRSGSERFENNLDTFYLRKYDMVSEYIFNDEYRCTEFRYGDTALWSYDHDSAGGYPETLCFHKDLQILFLQFSEYTNAYKCGEAGCVPLVKFPLAGFSSSKLRIQVHSGNGPVAPNDPSTCDEKSFGFGTEYIFKDDAKCTEVQYDGATVWDKECDRSDGKTPNKLFFHLYSRLLILDFSGFYLVYKHEGDKFEFVSRDSLANVTEGDFTFMAQEKQIDKSGYNFVQYPYGYAAVFLFNEDVQCSEIKFRGSHVWDRDGAAFPSLMYVNWDMKLLLLQSPEFLNAYMYIGGAWSPIFRHPDPNLESPDMPDPRGSQSDGNLRGPKGSSVTDLKTIILVAGSIVVSVLFLLLALVVFCYFK